MVVRLGGVTSVGGRDPVRLLLSATLVRGVVGCLRVAQLWPCVAVRVRSRMVGRLRRRYLRGRRRGWHAPRGASVRGSGVAQGGGVCPIGNGGRLRRPYALRRRP